MSHLLRFLLLGACLAACTAADQTSVVGNNTGGAPGSDAGAGPSDPLSCDGWTKSDPTSYSAVGAKIDHFPAVIEANLDTSADTMPYTLVLSEPAEVQLRVTMSIAGAGATVTMLHRTTAVGPGNTTIWTLGPGILPEGEHTISVQPGKTGSGPFRVEIEVFGARERSCDPAFVDPSAGKTDALSSDECTELLPRIFCSKLPGPVDEPASRKINCTVADAPCARAAREYLSCVAVRGTCDPAAQTLEASAIKAPSCAVRADVCP